MSNVMNWGDLVKDASTAKTGFDPIPDGDYDLEVKEASHGLTKDGSKTMYKIKAAVVSGPNAGRFIWDNLVITPGSDTALGFFFKKMRALGLPPEFFSTNSPSNDDVVARINGARFRAKVGSKTFGGKAQNEIKEYYVAPTAAAGFTPPPAAAPIPQAAPAPAPATASTYVAPAAAPAPSPSPWETSAPAAPPAAAPAPPAAAPAPAPAPPLPF